MLMAADSIIRSPRDLRPDGDVLRHVTVWESRAHKDRYEAEQLLPVFEVARNGVRRGRQYPARHLWGCSPLRPPGLSLFRPRFWDGRRRR
jgi:hypothetical protein